MSDFGYHFCPECKRRWSAIVDDNSSIAEKRCRDCALMPGWRNDFDSPPTPEQWQVFKETGRKIRGNSPAR